MGPLSHQLTSLTYLEDFNGNEGDEEEGRRPEEPLDQDFPEDDPEVGVVQPEVDSNETIIIRIRPRVASRLPTAASRFKEGNIMAWAI